MRHQRSPTNNNRSLQVHASVDFSLIDWYRLTPLYSVLYLERSRNEQDGDSPRFEKRPSVEDRRKDNAFKADIIRYAV